MTQKELKKISLKFRTLSSQMLKIDSEEEITHIRAFYDYITNTLLIYDYIQKCHKEDYDFEEIFNNLEWREKIILPSDSEELIDFEYQLLTFVLTGKRSLYRFGQNYTSSNKFKDMIEAFMRKVIEPFVVALKSYLEECLIDYEDLVEESTNDKTVFLSYCQKDSDVADLIDNGIGSQLSGKAKISRDIRDVEYHESFKQFMQSIEQHDYVITLISDNYLKSRNCMFEMLEVVKDSQFSKKLIYIVLSDEDSKYYSETPNNNIGANVYSTEGQTQYTIYWQSEESKIQRQIDEIGDPISAINQIKESKIIKKILLDMPEFLEFIRDSKGLSLTEHLSNNFSEIIKFMNV